MLSSFCSSTVCGGVARHGIAAIADPPNFDFNGYANFANVAGPSATVLLASVLTNNGVVPTPIPLDFTNNQYTLMGQGTLNSVSGITERYGNATIQIYADPIGSGTPADYGNLATFTDGTMILGGSFDGFLNRNTFTRTGQLPRPVASIRGRAGSLPTPQEWRLWAAGAARCRGSRSVTSRTGMASSTWVRSAPRPRVGER